MSAAPIIEKLTSFDIPVMGHVGLTPQSYHRMGGHRRQGRHSARAQHGRYPAGSRERVIEDARAVEQAGAFAVVLECIPPELAGEITAQLGIPTIGIGAGSACDGQILVCSDMLGMNPDGCPGFVKKYAELAQLITSAARRYVQDVRGERPGERSAGAAGARISIV